MSRAVPGRGRLLEAALVLAIGFAACGSGAPLPAASSAAGKPSLGAATGASKPALKPIKMGYSAVISNLPQWIALDSGLFAKYGLAVAATSVQGGPGVALPATQNGDYDIWQGAMDSYIVWCSRQPGDCPLVAIASAYHSTQTGLFAPAGSSIRRPADLKGKTIGILNKGSLTDYVLNAWLKQVGLKPQVDVQVRSMGGTQPVVAALQTKQIDAGTLTPPYSYEVLKEGMTKVVDFDKDIGPYESAQSIVNRQTLLQHRDALTSFLKGSYEGLAIARTDKAKALAVAAKYTGSSPEVLSQTYDDIMPLLNNKPYHSQAGTARILTTLMSLPATDYDIRLKPDAKPESFYSDALVQDLDKSGFFEQIGKQYGVASPKP